MTFGDGGRSPASDAVPGQRAPDEPAIVDIYDLTPMQAGMLFDARLAPRSPINLVQTSAHLTGPLDVPRLRAALATVVARHDALRTSFFMEELDHPVQVVWSHAEVEWKALDWRGEDRPAQQRKLAELLERDRARGFDLNLAPLLRVTVVRTRDLAHELVLTSHHAALDGWSLGVVFGETLRAYDASRARAPDAGPAVRFADYVSWLRPRSANVDRWRDVLRGLDGPTPLGIDTRAARTADSELGLGEHELNLSVEIETALHNYARKNRLTIGTVLHGVWGICLAAYSGRDDVVFGTVAMGRPPDLPGVEAAVGMFINTLPLRCRVASDQSIAAWLRTIQDEQLSLRGEEHAALASIRAAAGLASDQPLFESIVLVENVPFDALVANGGLRIGDVRHWQGATYPLELVAFPGEHTRLVLRYHEARFDRGAIERAGTHVREVLRDIVIERKRKVGEVTLVPDAERRRVLVEWNATAAPVPPPDSIHGAFEAQVDRSPNETALVVRDQRLTYAELDRRANQLAHRLIALGVGPEVVVGICLDRSIEMMVAVLAVLKAGGAYVPLDPIFPRDRLAFMAKDSGTSVIVTRAAMEDLVAASGAARVLVDEHAAAIAREPESRPRAHATATGATRAYLMYTSGSTGRPKGVMVEHRHVVAFFAGMDARIPHDPPGVWLALTSLSFDISVLELLWTLARAFTVVLSTNEEHDPRATPRRAPRARPVDVSLFYFASAEDERATDKYRLLMEGAKLADALGLTAVWTPERHFHSFGGLYPNPSVVSAAIAAATTRVQIRAGSCVIPLHNPIRVAEEWALVDNLSNGRVGLSFASGWHHDDFVLKPESYADSKGVMLRDIDVVRRLWRGEKLTFPGPKGPVEVGTLPRPVQKELPFWLTAAGNPKTFEAAGATGAHLLTHLLGQSVEELGAKIAAYREARRAAGYEEAGIVTLMLHTFLGDDDARVRELVREPMKRYLRDAIGLVAQLVHVHPTLRGRLDAGKSPHELIRELSPAELDDLLELAFDRYFETSGLFGSAERCLALLERLSEIGVDEVACLIDFGVDTDVVLESLPRLGRLRDAQREGGDASTDEEPYDGSIAGLIEAHGVTHIQATTSLVRALVDDPRSRAALSSLRYLMVGGEAIPGALAARLLALGGVTVTNMYGPTETTIWSSTGPAIACDASVPIGTPIANTQLYVVDARVAPVPIGVTGELAIGGAGVSRGYHARAGLTAERFIPDPFGASPGARLYRTGDRSRWLDDGTVDFLGRLDHQVKIRGYRVETGEIESHLEGRPDIASAVVVARSDASGDARLVAYYVVAQGAAAPSIEDLRRHLGERVPDYMVPSLFVALSALPLTPNGKIDRKALPAPELGGASQAAYVAPRTPTERAIAEAWREVLGVGRVGANDDFFALGGHSLVAMRLVSRLRQTLRAEVALRDVFEARTVAALAARIGDARTEAAPQIARLPRGGALPLSFAQERLWILHAMNPASAAYNEPRALRLRGPLDAGVLRRALVEVVRRHEVLRTRFVERDGAASQEIEPEPAIDFEIEDLRSLTAEARERRAVERMDAAARSPFDLGRPGQLRARLLVLSADEHVLVFVTHHIVADGWSLGVLVREVTAIYEAFLGDKASPLAEPELQYADFAAWQRQSLGAEALEPQLAYWKDALARAPDALALPTDRPRPAAKREVGAVRRFELDASLVGALGVVAKRAGATPFMVLLAGLDALLAKMTHERDIVVGTPIAGRRAPEVEAMMGVFINTLVIRTDLGGDPTFMELLGRVREATLGAYAHEDVPFEKVVEAVRPQRSLSTSPLFQVMFVLQNAEAGALRLPGVAIETLPIHAGAARFDLSIALRESGHALTGEVELDADLFDTATIDRLIAHYRAVLEQIARDPEQRLSDLVRVTPEERALVVDAWNATATGDAIERFLDEDFEAQASRTPTATAVVEGGRRVSYAELDAGANRIAHRLRALGVGEDALVGICVERSVDLVAAVLGVWKTGGAFVPLDPEHPKERLAFVLSDARPAVVIAQRRLADKLPAGGSTVLYVDDDDDADARARDMVAAAPRARGEQLAYAMYTSGSTGAPKAVMIDRRALANHMRWRRATFAQDARDAVLQNGAFGFDIAIWELFAPLLTGGRLVLAAPGREKEPRYLIQLMRDEAVTIAHFVPAALGTVLEETPGLSGCSALRQLFCGGDAVPVALIGRLLDERPDLEVWHQYGPTETCIVTTYWRCERGWAQSALPIGRPISNTQAYVVDETLAPVPIGVSGELCIGGVGVARGYLARPSLTAAMFVPDPFSRVAGARMYRSGDLSRWRRDGTLEFSGRIDHQIKVRGVRVEPGEIEATLDAHPAVAQSIVVARANGAGDKRLVAYVVPKEPRAPTADELRAFVRKKLPEQMVPSAFVPIAALPLTAHGKVDRRALPAPEHHKGVRPYVAPRTDGERALAGLFAEVLGLERVGRDADFFELGGHSLVATRLVSRIARSLGVDVPLRSLFERPTVERLATMIDEARREPARADLPAVRRVERPGPERALSYGEERMWFLWKLEPESTAYTVTSAVRMRGRLDPAMLEAALREIAARHEVLRTRYEDREGRPVAIVEDQVPFALAVRDCSATDIAGAVAELRTAFDLTRAPQMRARLFRLGPEEHVFGIAMHHVLSDAWSLGVLVRELGEIYEALVARRPASLPALEIRYGDFAAWQREWLAGERLERELAHWTRKLSGTPVLELPTDRPRPRVMSGEGAEHAFELDADLVDRVRAFAKRTSTTDFMVLVAAFEVLLSRHTGQRDFGLGVPTAGRSQPELESLIGFFVQTLVLRADLSGDPSFEELLARVREASLDAFAHQDTPFEKVVDALKLERRLDVSPLFQVMFVLQNAPAERLTRIAGVDLETMRLDERASQFDLTLVLEEDEGRLRGRLVYARELFDAETMARLGEHYARLLDALLRDPVQPVTAARFLGDDEARRLAEWNRTAHDTACDKCTHELVEEQVARTPHAIAVEYGDHGLSYRELDERANRLAHLLRDAGVGPETRVGLLVERSVEMIVALLGVLKSGGAYVPLDPGYPPDRLAFMIEDAGVQLVLTQERHASRAPPGVRVVALDAAVDPLSSWPSTKLVAGSRQRNLMYVLYTSGSSGRPKAVLVEHGGVVNRLLWGKQSFGDAAAEVVVQKTPFTFDVSGWELYMPLLAGGRLVFAEPEMHRDAAYLVDLVATQEVRTIHFVSSMLTAFAAVADEDRCATIAHVVCSGEALTGEIVRSCLDALPHVVVHNLYGPTEASIEVTHFACARSPGEVIPMGRPIWNTELHALDPAMAQVPIGAPGELYIGGVQVARGYRNQPALTAERFVPDPVSGRRGARLYRTGDLTRVRANGVMDFLGRIDHQVKVRGFRIELGEIESVLEAHARVRHAVVVARDDGPGRDKRLVAYIVAEVGSDPPRADALREHASRKLPDYMLPSAFVPLAELPLSAHGKVDRRALPAPAGADRARPYEPPRTELERTLAGVWADVLELERVGRDDDFFTLGGHSLLATRVVARLREIGLDLPVRTLFEAPTLAEFAAQVSARGLTTEALAEASAVLDALESMPENVREDLTEEELTELLRARKIRRD